MLAIIVATGAGVAFARNGNDGASLAAAAALFCYLAAIFACGSRTDG